MTAAGVSADQVLSAVATSVVLLSRCEVPDDPIYDSVTQRALNHVVLRCVTTPGFTVPQSVPHLIDLVVGRQAHQWLPGSASEAVLINEESRRPTQECLELIVDWRDPFGERFENEILDEVFRICRDISSPDSYVAFRRLLIDHPSMTESVKNEQFSDILLLPLQEVLERCYIKAPASLQRRGYFAPCPGCSSLLVPVREEEWVCDLDRCHHSFKTSDLKFLDARSERGVYQLQYPLRAFVTGPGLFELELEKALAAKGLEVELWPDFDTYDLLVTLPDGRRWGVDVKDYANPGVLGRRFKAFKPFPGLDKPFLVVPTYRFHRSGYDHAFRHARDLAHPGLSPVTPISTKEFLRRIDQTLPPKTGSKGGAHA